MIHPEDILDHLRRTPFEPFVVHLSDGKAYAINHPDLVVVFGNRLEILVPRDATRRIMDHAEHCALAHITRIEELHRKDK